MDNLHFLPNNILTRIFKELKYIYIRMSTNNIYIGKSSFASHINTQRKQQTRIYFIHKR